MTILVSVSLKLCLQVNPSLSIFKTISLWQSFFLVSLNLCLYVNHSLHPPICFCLLSTIFCHKFSRRWVSPVWPLQSFFRQQFSSFQEGEEEDGNRNGRITESRSSESGTPMRRNNPWRYLVEGDEDSCWNVSTRNRTHDLLTMSLLP